VCFTVESLDKVYDIDIITSDYLIENIDMAYNQWQNLSWNKNLSFGDFCEYLLPYRLGNEPLENWRTVYYKKYGQILDSIYSGADIIEAANQLSLYVDKSEDIVHYHHSTFIDVEPLFFLNNKSGNCIDLTNATIYALRSVGIPAVRHFYISAPDDYNIGHSWTAIRDTTGAHIAFNNIGLSIERGAQDIKKKGKVYQLCYECQDKGEYDNRYVASFFMDPLLKDVTAAYSGRNKLEINFFSSKNPYIYLGVLPPPKTIPIAVTKAKDGKAVFADVEPGLVYQLLQYNNGMLVPAGYPVSIDSMGSIHTFTPNLSDMQNLTIYRKWFLPKWLYTSINSIVNSTLEGSANRNFSDITFSYQLQDSILYDIEKIFSIGGKTVQYIRYTSSDSSIIDIAEVYVYAIGNSIPIRNMEISGANPVPHPKKRIIFENLIDGDILTYYISADSAATITFDLLKPIPLDRIELLPRTDDNFIRIGDVYELFYHGGEEGWKSLGQQQAKNLYLKYTNIPSNALLWLRNHTRGEEEQVFYIKNGVQVFAGKENIVYGK
jgi:hypothetical protein